MPTVHREIVLPVARERAWELITDPAELERWLADEVELDPEPGGAVRARWDDGEARDGVVDTVQAEAELRFRWWDGEQEGSEVHWRLEPAVAGTRLVVVERRLGAGPVAGASHLAATAQPLAWAPRLASLSALAVACPA